LLNKLNRLYVDFMYRGYTRVVDSFMTGFCKKVETAEQWELMKIHGYFRCYREYLEEVGMWGGLRPIKYIKATVKYSKACQKAINQATAEFLERQKVYTATLPAIDHQYLSGLDGLIASLKKANA
jgi:hypothetical protein